MLSFFLNEKYKIVSYICSKSFELTNNTNLIILLTKIKYRLFKMNSVTSNIWCILSQKIVR